MIALVMRIDLGQELEIWVTALQRYDANEFEEAITVFEPIADTSKILFNCGVIRATLGEHAQAVRGTNLGSHSATTNIMKGRFLPACYETRSVFSNSIFPARSIKLFTGRL